MEAADHPSGTSDVAARPSMMVRFYYSKRNQSPNPKLLSPTFQEGQPMPNGILPTDHQRPLNEFEVGGFYEIDHGGLPPKSPAQLKLIRVVVVNEKTNLGITVIFPSLLSLREYLSMEDNTYALSHGKRKPRRAHPELDEQFVMSSNHAAKILRRLVTEMEANASQHLECFWVITPLVSRSSREEEQEEEGEYQRSKVSPSLRVALQSAEVSGWGVRRRVTYVARNKGKSPFQAGVRSPHMLAMVTKEEVLDKREPSCDANASVSNAGWKRKKSHKKKAKKPKLELVRLSEYGSNRHKSPKDRWSTERYASAELKLLDIMKEKNAVLGNPILRVHLREEARKHIGDTGLLDHLLKHMAGKVVFGGKERFRRCHNVDGAMEYWLEDANLEELRHIAGVRDPSWTPSSSPCCKPCGLELSQLKEELVNIRGVLKELCASKNLGENGHEDTSKSGGDGSTSTILEEMREELLKRKADDDDHLSKLAGSLQDIKEMREELLQWKAEEKEQLSKMATSMQDIKEQVGSLTEEITRLRKGSRHSHGSGPDIEVAAPTSVCGEKGGGRRSGFRVCQPHGTFLWPDMGVQRHLGSNVEDQSLLLEVPTPRSASSVTSPPLPQQSQQQQYFCNQHYNQHPHPVHGLEQGRQRQQLVLVGGGGVTTDVMLHGSPHGQFTTGTSSFAEKKKCRPVVGNSYSCNLGTNTISTDLALASPTYRS